MLGALTLNFLSGDEFPPDTLDLANTIANHAVAAITTADLYDRATRRAQELTLLNAIGNRLTANLELGTVLQSIAEAAFELFQADDAVIWCLQPDKTLEPLARAGRAGWLRTRPVTVQETRPQVLAMQTQAIVFIPDLEVSSLAPEPLAAGLREAKVEAGVYVPMLHQGQAVGVIAIKYGTTPQVSAERQQLMGELAAHAAAAITNARILQEAASLAATDGLTGLVNYREFQRRFTDEVRRAQVSQAELCLVLLDLDDFKQVNDRYGHLQGDAALQEVAEILRRQARAIDLVARCDGEEFAIIMPDTGLAAATQLAEQIRRAIAEHQFCPLTPGGLRMTASLGVAGLAGTEPSPDPESLFAAADRALYTAKRSGKNRYVLSGSRDGPHHQAEGPPNAGS